MYIFLIPGFSITGIILSLVFSHYAYRYKVYLALFRLTLLVILTTAIYFFAGIENVTAKAFLSFLITWGPLVWFMITAFLIATLFRNRKPGKGIADPVEGMPGKILRSSLLSVTLMCSSFFFMVSIGKLKSSVEMEAFFTASGYPVSFNYIIIAVECICSLLLLINLRSSIKIAAALMLILIMLGAVFTHLRNGDPLADSYDAFKQITILIFLFVLYYLKINTGSFAKRGTI